MANKSVEPIREKKLIKSMQTYLKGKSRRNLLLFNLGLNTGLRIGDILPLKVSDIMSESNNFKNYLVLHEEKTNKIKKIKLNDKIKSDLKSYISKEKLEFDSNLFESRNGEAAISYTQAYRVLKEASGSVGVQDFGTHSMRKTWGYWTYKTSKYNIGLIMDMFNHSSQSMTLKYIGINQDMHDEIYSKVQF